MESSKEKPPEQMLRDELKRAEEFGKAIASQGREITKTGQMIADRARATRDIVESAPDLIDIETQMGLWSDINEHLGLVPDGLTNVQEQMYLASGTTSTASVSVIFSIASAETVISSFSEEKREKARAAIENFDALISHLQNKEEVLDLLEAWGFNEAAPGKKSAVEQYLTAYEAFEGPLSDTDPVSTSLIPMRECISTVIAELLRRRPRQEKAPSNYKKIISIGMQLRREGISEDVVQEWARLWDKLADELSEAKQGEISREEWGRRLQQATLFLSGFLKGLDPSKG